MVSHVQVFNFQYVSDQCRSIIYLSGVSWSLCASSSITSRKSECDALSRMWKFWCSGCVIACTAFDVRPNVYKDCGGGCDGHNKRLHSHLWKDFKMDGLASDQKIWHDAMVTCRSRASKGLKKEVLVHCFADAANTETFSLPMRRQLHDNKWCLKTTQLTRDLITLIDLSWNAECPTILSC